MKLGKWLRHLLACLSLFSLVAALADEPLLPPARYDVRSPSGKFIATLDPNSGTQVRAARSSHALWKTSLWFRCAVLADDGEHFISEYDGLNLIPQDYKKDMALLTFWHRDKKVRDVTLGELFPDTSALRKTVSHYDWGGITGITNATLIVIRCDKKVVRFNITTGEMVK